jgi:acid phosphatase family membrane protein YuiD
MNEFSNILTNQVLIVALIACGSAQAIKLLFQLIRFRRINWNLLFSSGGMPSSHSALVGALATAVGEYKGWGSPEFAIACLFAVVVMYDAAGVRQAAGKHAKVLNKMREQWITEENIEDTFTDEKLKELLGHTPLQVLAGLILGICTAVGAYALV